MSDQAKKSRGRPRYEPTPTDRHNVSMLRAFGLRHEDIAKMVINPHTRKPINLRTLERKFKRELADGLQKANAVAAGVVWHHIKKKNLGAAIFWLKTRASWKSAKQVEFFANEDDEPSQVKIEFVKPKGSSDGEGPTP